MKQKNNRIQHAIVIVLIVIAAAWLGFSSIELLNDPSRTSIIRQSTFDSPDMYNIQLNQLQIILGPINQYIAPDVPLRYVKSMNHENDFDFIQAVLAPRRIGPDVDSHFIYISEHSEDLLVRHPELINARLLVRLFRTGGVFRRETRE